MSLSVGNLPAALWVLRLSNLGLQRLPVALKECKELRTLDLSHNDFAMHWTGSSETFRPFDFSEESWLGELPFLGALDLCDAVKLWGGHWDRWLTEQVLETLPAEHWLRKWDGQLNLAES